MGARLGRGGGGGGGDGGRSETENLWGNTKKDAPGVPGQFLLNRLFGRGRVAPHIKQCLLSIAWCGAAEQCSVSFYRD